MEAGIDSIAASEVVESINAVFAMELPATLLFDYPSIASISKHVKAFPITPSLCEPCDESAAMPVTVLSQKNLSSAAVASTILQRDVESQVDSIIR